MSSSQNQNEGVEPGNQDYQILRAWSQLHDKAVYRRGDVVIRETGPWAATVHALLRHLEEVGFTASPRIVGSGFDSEGRETLTYIEGEFMHPGPWTLEGATEVGTLLRDLHKATASFRPSQDAIWKEWFGREFGGSNRVIGHCDFAPWNIVAHDGHPVALIDWDFAGPVDPLVELAQVCWLNAKLHDDIVAEREGLPPLAERAKQVRAIVDAYGLTANQRAGFIDKIIEFVILDTAEMADDAAIMPDTRATDAEPLWGMAWRARAARWILHNRQTLQNALA